MPAALNTAASFIESKVKLFLTISIPLVSVYLRVAVDGPRRKRKEEILPEITAIICIESEPLQILLPVFGPSQSLL